jgi:hypothetical protein
MALDKPLKLAETSTFSARTEHAKSSVRSAASGSTARYVIASGGEVATS